MSNNIKSTTRLTELLDKLKMEIIMDISLKKTLEMLDREYGSQEDARYTIKDIKQVWTQCYAEDMEIEYGGFIKTLNKLES
tara:strand:+ start:98 stop:340 length:243 start_codon:yes stop_codon:yes gene_type:complete